MIRPLARVELRQVRRHPARSWLVVLLVAVPVAAMVGGSTLLEITQRTPDEERARSMGGADLRVEPAPGRGAAELSLPPGARATSVAAGREAVHVPGRRLHARSFRIEARALEPDGAAEGMLRVTRGRAPTGPDEVALSPALSAALARPIDATVTLDDGPKRVTGLVIDPEDLDLPVVLRAREPSDPCLGCAWLVDLPDDEVEPTAARLREAGHRVTARSDLGQRDAFESTAVFVVGGFGFFEAALVVAASFAVGLRRRQREIGLLGANGASAAGVRASIAISALALACAGAALGAALGLGAAGALHPFLDGWNRRANGPFEMSLPHVLGAVCLGLVTAVGAAALPARRAARLPILVALGGRRPVTERPRAWLVAGLALCVGGFGFVLEGSRSAGASAAIEILSGSILGVLGLGACSPWILRALGNAAAPLPLAWRLAVRDAGRFGSRNGAVVTAVLAAMSVSVMLAALGRSVEAMLQVAPAALRDDQLAVDGPGAEEVARRLCAELECVARAPLAALHAQGEPVSARIRIEGDERARDGGPWVAVGSAELLRALGADGEPGDARERVVALVHSSDALALAQDAPEVRLFAGGRELARLPATGVAVDQRVRTPPFAIHADAARALGLESGPPPGAALVPWIVRLENAVTADTLERASRIAVETSEAASIDAALLHRGPESGFLRLVLACCTVTGLVVVFVATALSSVESAADARVLHVVGAAPTLLWKLLAARAGYLALLGGFLAIPAGLVPSYGLLSLADVPLEFSVPWAEVAAVALGLPALAFTCTFAFAALSRADRTRALTHRVSARGRRTT